MRKNKVFLPIFALSVTLLSAKPVELSTATRVASSHLSIMQTRLSESEYLSYDYTSLSTPQPLCQMDSDDILAYVFTLDPQGFVVVSADDDIVPVIAYSEHGVFPWFEDTHNILLHMLRYDIKCRLELTEVTPPEIICKNHNLWKELSDGEPVYLDPGESWPEGGDTWTGGWVESMWHQGSPYNSLCPVDPETGFRSIVGCVATAMGQIVNYWQYPSSVTFTTEDNYVAATRGIEIYAPDASISYIDYRDGNPNHSTSAAISYACGVGSKMNYTSEASGAYPKNTAISFVKHFKYHNADRMISDEPDFYTVLEQNMKDGKPSMLWVKVDDTTGGGHEIVCDGFRKTDIGSEWHLNFGWNNNPDALPVSWYMLPWGCPYFPFIKESVVNIEPTEAIAEDIPSQESLNITCTTNLTFDDTRIKYHLPSSAHVTINVWDATGRRVRVLTDEIQSQGEHTLTWDGCDDEEQILPKGAYFLRLQVENTSKTEKILRVR